MTYIKQVEPSILCPMFSSTRINPRHTEWVAAQDEIYYKAPNDSNGDPANDSEYRIAVRVKAREMHIYSETPDFMNLFHAETNVIIGNRCILVASWYFKCPVCDFVLPAHAEPA